MSILDDAQPYVAALEKRALTIRAVAKIIGCSESYLSRILSPTLKREESSTKKRKKQAKLVESRREMRKKHAILVKLSQKSLKKAASDARCSERTLRRYIKALD